MTFLESRVRMARRVALACALAVGLSACVTAREQVTQKEDSLSAAGFVIRPANTPERIAMLKRLPPHHFIQEVRGDTVSYVYADPLVCNCLYVGSQDAYGRYRLFMQQQRLAEEQQLTAQMYSDSAWNWDAWGPWGPGYGGGFVGGFGPGW